jgi:FK506-binding protein 1
LVGKLTANGTAILLSAVGGDDYEACTRYFKLALQVDAGSLQVAKLLQLSLALFVDPSDKESKREVTQLRAELAKQGNAPPPPSAPADASQPAATAEGAGAADAGSSAAEAVPAPNAPSQAQPQPQGLYDPSLQIVSPGVRKQVLRAGDGVSFPKKGDLLTMHYTGSLAATGKVFDSSVERGDPFRFQVGIGQVIQGWDEGVVRMSLGEKAVLHIGSQCAYGSEAVGDGAIPANSDLVFEVELLAIGNQTSEMEDEEDLGASVTDTVMGGLFGGAWQFITGQDLLPAGEVEDAEILPHAWKINGCPDARYAGVYTSDEAAPETNSQPHYCNEHGMHLYRKDGWWVLKDIFTPTENSSIARLRSSANGQLLAGKNAWDWWKDGDWASVVVEMRLEYQPLRVSGSPEGRYAGLYRQDVTHAIANGQPHFTNEAGMHLFFGMVKGWCKSVPLC